MDTVLIVEDSESFASVIRKRLEADGDSTILTAYTMAEALDLLNSLDESPLALLDLNLPDAPNGEIVDAFMERNIPSIVFTSNDANKGRLDLYKKGIIDYVVKGNPSSLDYLASLVNRVRSNCRLKALVVDDSRATRRFISSILRRFQLAVVEAANGLEAIERLEEDQGIKLIITDCEMPVVDGVNLVKTVRKTYSKDEVAIIGISASGSSEKSAQFIKNGANDFINKPFGIEEILCRVTQNLDYLDQIASLKDAATTAYLTGLFNRRFFFDTSIPILAQAKRRDRNVTIAMIDIDHFKVINDNYGHEAGDEVLKAVAAALKNRCREADILARIGGEEFCLMLVDCDVDYLPMIAEDLLSRVAGLTIECDGIPIKTTISIGISTARHDSVADMIADADALLYRAKEGGRKRAVIASGQDTPESLVTL